MPVARLHVEGNLDVEVLAPLMASLANGPVVVPGGSKGSLAPKTRDRRETVPLTCYVRDRDFDFDPPADRSSPQIDQLDTRKDAAHEVLGWRWCRHSIECYLLEPSIVEAATQWPTAAYAAALTAGAHEIRHYSTARWTVGVFKQTLLSLDKLATRPTDLKHEIKLPAELGEEPSRRWAEQSLAGHVTNVGAALDPGKIQRALDHYASVLAGLTTSEDLLVWHSGKDLLAALAQPVRERFKKHPQEFLAQLRDWIRLHPGETLELLPEWRTFVSLMRN